MGTPAPRVVHHTRAVEHDAVYVGYGSPYANPFTPHGDPHAAILDLYRTWLTGNPDILARYAADLTGRNLSCWCPPGVPCHASVLLDLVNTVDPA